MRDSVACAVWILASHIFSVGVAWRDADLSPTSLQNAEFTEAFAKVQSFFALDTEEPNDEDSLEEASRATEKKKVDKKASWPAVEWADSDFIIVDPFEEEEEKRPSRKKNGGYVSPTTATKHTLYAARVGWRPSGNKGYVEPNDQKEQVEYLTHATLLGGEGVVGAAPCQKGDTMLPQTNHSTLADLGELKASGSQDVMSLPVTPAEEDDDESQDVTVEGTDPENQEEEQEDDGDPKPSEELQEEEDEDESEAQGQAAEDADDGDKASPMTDGDAEDQAPLQKEEGPAEGVVVKVLESLAPKKLRSPQAVGFIHQQRVQKRVKDAQIPLLALAAGVEDDGGEGEAADLREGQELESAEEGDDEEGTAEKSSNQKTSSDGPKVTEDIEDTEEDTLPPKLVPTVFGVNRNYQRLGVRAPYVPVPIGEESSRQTLLYKLVKVPKDVQEANRGRLKRVTARGQPRSMRVISVKEVDPASMTLDVSAGSSTGRTAAASNVVAATRAAPSSRGKPCGGARHKQVGVVRVEPRMDGVVQASEHDVLVVVPKQSDSDQEHLGSDVDSGEHADKGEDSSESSASKYKDDTGESHAHHGGGEHAEGGKSEQGAVSEHDGDAHEEGGHDDHHGEHSHSDGHEGDDHEYAEKGQDLSEHAQSKFKEKGKKEKASHDEGKKSGGKHMKEKGSSGHEDHGYKDHKSKKRGKGFRDKYKYDKTKKHDSFYSNHKKKGSWKQFGHEDSYHFDDDDKDEKGNYKKSGSKKSGGGHKGFWQDLFDDDDDEEWEGSKGYHKKYGGGDSYEDKEDKRESRQHEYTPGFYSWG